jgi:ribosome biogenesis GTPase
VQGTVVRALGGFFTVDAGDTIAQCRARGVFRKRGTTVLVGDRVIWEPVSGIQAGVQEGLITQVEPRTTELIRPPIANCDHAVLVFSVRSPDFHGQLLDRTLVSVAVAGLSATVVLSKTDLLPTEEVTSLGRPYREAGYRVLRIGRDDESELEALRDDLAGHISVFAGPSGAGKSSLANLLAPELGLKMGEISGKLGRGKHTTRHVELFSLARSTFVADAPGFSQLQVTVESDELRLYFPDFVARAADCEYRGCLHLNEQDCAVKSAVSTGVVSLSRYQSYKFLYEEIRKEEERRY